MIKVLYVIDILNIGGASDYLISLSSEFNFSNEINVICKKNYRINNIANDFNFKQVDDAKSLIDFYFNNKFNVIHWFKSQNCGFFKNYCKKIKSQKINIPLIITVCQNPKSYEHRITPSEIKYSKIIVFIDKNSFNFKDNKFLDASQKKLIYFGTKWPNDIENQSNDQQRDYILYGRGSSINKCHPDFINWFNSINIVNKKFCIAGISENSEWISSEISKFNLSEKVFVLPHLNKSDWLNLVKTFDVFLYQLPLNSYSSIDGTMQAAMYFCKPIVYYGPESPKELIQHGKTGFIANCKKEFIYYAELLAKNKKIRDEIGSHARKHLLEHFSWSNTVENYRSLYYETIKSEGVNYSPKFRFILNYIFLGFIMFIKKSILNILSKSFKTKLKKILYFKF
jgi:glycosyltransferase involved in cell wall biosynthesis